MDTPSLSAIVDGGNTVAQPIETSTAAPAAGDAKEVASNPNPTGEPAKAETQDGTPPPEKPKQEKSEVDKAIAAIRRELRDAKRQNAELTARMQQPPRQPIDPIALTPEAFERELGNRLQQASIDTKIQTSIGIAEEKYPDWQDMVEVFDAEHPPGSEGFAEMLASRNPAEFAYKKAKEAVARREMGDPVQYAEKIRKEATEKALADLDKVIAARVQERLSALLPTSLADTRTQGARVTNPTGFNGPTPLDSILNSK